MDIIKKIAQEIGCRDSQVEAAVKLIDEGNTIPFIARYRKEATGSLNDEQLRLLHERLVYLRNLEDKKAQVIASIEEQGKLTDQLRTDIEKAETMVLVDDLYRPYRPKRKTRATIAKDKGLEGLANIIMLQMTRTPIVKEAEAYVSEEKGVADTSEAIAGAMDIIAENISDTADYRTHIRDLMKNYFEEKGIPKRTVEIERLLEGCVGVRRTTGQHPGGIVVLPMGWTIDTFTPVQHPANDQTTSIITTHFDYHKIDHNLLKLDILGHDDPTIIKMLEDLTGVNALNIPLDDEQVLSLFNNTSALGVTPDDLMGLDLGSLGVPEFGTEFVMQMLRDTKPKNFSDLVRISGLSHGTDVWLNNAQYYIARGDCTLSTAICTRDDIMTYLIHTGVEDGTAFNIMEKVRKGLVAKGKVPQWEEWKETMKQAGVPDWYIESCGKIKYMFPKAHAVAYVMMAFRIAYFKVYYPLAYYAAFFSIRAKAFDYELMCQGRERLETTMKDYKKRLSAKQLSPKEEAAYGDMKIVQEMYARGYEFMPIDIFTSKAYLCNISRHVLQS